MGDTVTVVCLECATPLGGDTGKDPYKHMLHCLKVEPDSLSRLREKMEGERTENSRRVLHIVNSLLSAETASSREEL